MDKTIKLKEAFKFALSFALVYGIALQVNWLSPSWAGWAVVAISATSGGGESLQKGLFRIWGTVLASIVGITIISVASQNRWLFMILTASWLFFCAYKMLVHKEKSYFWFVAGYTALVITAAGASSVGGFYLAVFRTMETILGIVVYTLVAVLLWPRSNIGSIKKALTALLNTQTNLLQKVYDVLCGIKQTDKIKELSQLQAKQLQQFRDSLKAEGSENYLVKELKPLWNQFDSLNNNLMKSINRLYRGIEDLSTVENKKNQPDIDRFFKEMNNRFTEMTSLLSGNKPMLQLQDLNMEVTTLERSDLSNFDKAALAIIIVELNKIEAISQEMVTTATTISNYYLTNQKVVSREVKTQKKSAFNFPIFDIEYLKGAFYVAATVIVGFIIWFYINPPGHSEWYILGGVFALIFAGAQQVNALKLIAPFIVVMLLVALIYVFILPKLTTFYQLGLLLFTCMFVIQYFLSGAIVAIFNMIILQVIVINNPQSYNAVTLINSFAFVPLLLIFIFYMSYLINTPRPEKAFIKLVSRFFKSAKYLVSEQAERNTSTSSSFIQRYKTAFYQHELQSLPAKINAWGKAIDVKLFPNTDFQQIEEMVNVLEVFVSRMEILMETKGDFQENELIELSETIKDWRQRLITTFDNWDAIPEEEIKSHTDNLIVKRMNEMEEKLKAFVTENENSINKDQGIQFYQLLGGYRGVTDATLLFAKVADKLDWDEWKEERFE